MSRIQERLSLCGDDTYELKKTKTKNSCSVAKRADLKKFSPQQKYFLQLFVVADVNYTYCDDHFTICTTINSLCCILETNIMLHVNYTSKKKCVFSFNECFLRNQRKARSQ